MVISLWVRGVDRSIVGLAGHFRSSNGFGWNDLIRLFICFLVGSNLCVVGWAGHSHGIIPRNDIFVTNLLHIRYHIDSNYVLQRTLRVR